MSSFKIYDLGRLHAIRGRPHLHHRNREPYPNHQDQRSYDNGYKVGLALTKPKPQEKK